MDFIDELKAVKDIISIKNGVWQKYGKFLFGSEIDRMDELSPDQMAFLYLLDQKWPDVVQPLIDSEVKREFDEWYDDEDNDVDRYNEIRLLALDIRKILTGEWELAFEDDNEDLVVHVFMKEWGFDYCARTG